MSRCSCWCTSLASLAARLPARECCGSGDGAGDRGAAFPPAPAPAPPVGGMEYPSTSSTATSSMRKVGQVAAAGDWDTRSSRRAISRSVQCVFQPRSGPRSRHSSALTTKCLVHPGTRLRGSVMSRNGDGVACSHAKRVAMQKQ